MHVLHRNWFLVGLKIVLILFLLVVELIDLGFLLLLNFLFPKVFHGIFKVLNFFSELIFFIRGHKFEFIFFFFDRVGKHVELLPVLFNTLIELILFDFINNGGDVGFNVFPHVKDFLKVFIQVVDLDMCQLDVLFFLLTQILQVLLFHLGQNSEHLIVV